MRSKGVRVQISLPTPPEQMASCYVRLADLKAISGFDLPAKSVMISVALGKIVGVLGNEARMVIRYLHMGQ